MKTCCTCKIEKDESEFSKSSTLNDGLQKVCKKCDSERRVKRYNSNIELSRENGRKRAEKCKDNRAKYAKDNAEKINQLNRDSYHRNKEKISQARKLKPKTELLRKKAAESAVKWRKENRERYNVLQRAYKKENSLQIKAVQKVNDALRRGGLTKPTICSICMKEGRIQGHHHDYSKPLEIQWLCSVCHCKVHGKLK